ncbi:MAG: class III extradiol ring-cleavage dioxygenase [Salaquimonas sp.]
MKQPSIFISHGAPTIVIDGSQISVAIRELSSQFAKPDAIVIASAHFETNIVEVVSDPAPDMLYDFGPFDPRLFEMDYPAKGSPVIAGQVLQLLKQAGINSQPNSKRPYDHGIWTPLMLAFPEADIPVVQISVQPSKDANHHFKIGKALSGLRDNNILVIGSGHITHNLRAVFNAMQGRVLDPEMKAKTDQFVGYMEQNLVEGNCEALLDWEQGAPFALENHPTPEHFMPLFIAYGAGGENTRATLLHRSTQYELFVSDIWRFD